MLEKLIAIALAAILGLSTVPTIDEINNNFEQVIEQNISTEDLEAAQQLILESNIEGPEFIATLQALLHTKEQEQLQVEVDSFFGEGWVVSEN